MRYVKRIEDTSLWKKQFEDSGKGFGHLDGDYYIVNHTGKGEPTQTIPPVAQDIIMAKSKIRKKRRIKRKYKQKRPSGIKKTIKKKRKSRVTKIRRRKIINNKKRIKTKRRIRYK